MTEKKGGEKELPRLKTTIESTSLRPKGTRTKPSTEKRGRKRLDLVGKRYGMLTVVRRGDGCDKNGKTYWVCCCDCGNSVTVGTSSLVQGHRKSCGCLQKKTIDITGQRFGRLTALYPIDGKRRLGAVVWKCRCDCGNEVEVAVAMLRSGNNKSCGCMKTEVQRMLHDRLHLSDGTCVEWLIGREKRSDNRSGCTGVFKKKNGKYSVSLGFKKRYFYLGTYENYYDAVEVRKKGEEIVFHEFIRSYNVWQKMAEADAAWKRDNPFVFDVYKEDNRLIVNNSMEKYLINSGQ